MFAHISPESTEQKLPRVPNPALVTEGLNTYLFVETSPGVLQRRRVKLAFRGVDASYVAEGVVPGERVVTTGAILLNAELAGN
jgi:cobalt-zinc-cadmium efflux system membrane fusion protein